MRVDEHCLTFFMKVACRIEAGDYNRNFQRQARTTSGRVLALLQSPLLFVWEQVLDTFRPEAVASKDQRIGFSKSCKVDSMVFLRSSAFELLIEFNIALAPTSPGTALVSSAALAVFASSLLKDGAL